MLNYEEAIRKAYLAPSRSFEASAHSVMTISSAEHLAQYQVP